MLIALLATVAAVVSLAAQPVTQVSGPSRKNLGPAVNGAGAEILPVVTADGATLYLDRRFDSLNVGGVDDPDDIFQSHRNAAGNWSAPRNLGSPFNTTGSDALLWVSRDGNKALVHSDALPPPRLALAIRTDGAWGPLMPVAIDGISDVGESYYATIAPDERRMILALARDSTRSDNSDLFVATLASPDLLHWNTPTPLSSIINTERYEGAPFIAWDNRTLYFASDRYGGLGGSDIWVSQRLGESWAVWSEPINLGSRVNTPAQEESLTLPRFDSSGYYSSPGEYGEMDIFHVRLPDALLPTRVVVVNGMFRAGGRGVVGLIRAIRNRDQTETGSTSSASDGSFTLMLPPGDVYTITGWSPQTGEVESQIDGTAIIQGEVDCILQHPGEREANGGGRP